MTDKMSGNRDHAWLHKKHKLSPGDIRKANKPLMEKKRRARINDSLAQLKTLVLEAMKRDTSRYSKLEKADILEMTVKHLRSLQRQQLSDAMTVDKTVIHKYQAGFTECAAEVNRYLKSIDGLNPTVQERLLGHLTGCMQKLSTVAPPVQSNCQQQAAFINNTVQQQQRLPSNTPNNAMPSLSTFTAIANHQAVSIMSPLQIQIPAALMNANKHPLPTPPPSTDGPHLPPPSVRPVHHQLATVPSTQTPNDIMAYQRMVSQSGFNQSHAQLASRGHEFRIGYSEVRTSAQNFNIQPVQRGGALPVEHQELYHYHRNETQYGYYGDRTLVTRRDSMSTPSPSQRSLSPPRCESTGSVGSGMTGYGSPSPRHHQPGRFSPVPPPRACTPSHTIPPRCYTPSSPPPQVHPSQPHTQVHFQTYNPVHAHTKITLTPLQQMHIPKQAHTGTSSPPLAQGSQQIYSAVHAHHPSNIAVDLSRPHSQEPETPGKELQVDLNDNVVDPQHQPEEMEKQDSMWRPW